MAAPRASRPLRLIERIDVQFGSRRLCLFDAFGVRGARDHDCHCCRAARERGDGVFDKTAGIQHRYLRTETSLLVRRLGPGHASGYWSAILSAG